MIDTVRIHTDLDSSTEALLARLDMFSPESFTRQHAPGQWTPAQVAE
ncbi:MAG: hypothetical protein JWP27_900, partial [Flaviaesturariibacter sp.]|nr:hypothetical protein [Flaviaesturariibacter sp.]